MGWRWDGRWREQIAYKKWAEDNFGPLTKDEFDAIIDALTSFKGIRLKEIEGPLIENISEESARDCDRVGTDII